jgi:hypothetical protein
MQYIDRAFGSLITENTKLKDKTKQKWAERLNTVMSSSVLKVVIWTGPIPYEPFDFDS